MRKVDGCLPPPEKFQSSGALAPEFKCNTPTERSQMFCQENFAGVRDQQGGILIQKIPYIEQGFPIAQHAHKLWDGQVLFEKQVNAAV